MEGHRGPCPGIEERRGTRLVGEQTKEFLLGQPARLVFVRLDGAARVAVLVDPGAAVSVIERTFDQMLTQGFDFAVLPPELNWCVVGNEDGEIFYCTRLG